MKQEDIKTLSEASFFIDAISKHIFTLKNVEKLYVISDHDLGMSFQSDAAISVPDCLVNEFKQKLEKYYLEKLSEYIKKLNTIEL